MKPKWVQAYKQIPWRAQIKWGSRFLMFLAISAMIIGLYLSLSAQAASIGIDIQRSEIAKDNLEQEIADMRSQLALLTSEREMEYRARELGFEFADLSKALYVVVPGYIERQPVELASPYNTQLIAHPIIKPSYTQSLLEWLSKNALQLQDGQEGERS